MAFRLLEEDGRGLYVMMNTYWEDLSFHLPDDVRWRRVVDTAEPSPQDICEDPAGVTLPVNSNMYSVRARSIVVLVGASVNSDSA